MKKNIILSVILVFLVLSGYSQSDVNQDSMGEIYNSIPAERVFLHVNTTLVFTGEYLYYKAYTMDSKNSPSKVSHIGYVALIDQDNKEVFKHKIILENGKGQGDFFINPSIYSGNYKLVGYTQWMLNNDKAFFAQDISLINPYQDNQKAIVDVVGGNAISLVDKMPSVSSNVLNVSLDKDTYGKRDHVKLSFKSINKDVEMGHYSVSVRKKNEAFNVAPFVSSKQYASQFLNVKRNSGSDKVMIPELRGELLSGKVMFNGTPSANKEICFSIPGENYIMKIIKTNEEGEFYVNLEDSYEQEYAYVQVIEENPNDYTLVFNEQPTLDVSKEIFFKFQISEKQRASILQRSINNQVESNYFVVKPDSLVELSQLKSFYGTPTVSFLLDDYARFSDLKETFVEIVGQAGIVNSKGGKQEFYVRPYEFSLQTNAKPLVLIDGIIIQNHNDIISYNANGIKRINILRDKYYLGEQFYQGIVDISTIDGVYASQIGQDYVKKYKLFKPRPIKKYYRQSYTSENMADYKRIPDYRSQLLWIPSYSLSNSADETFFYTSDVSGVYVIHLEGFTESGVPVSITKEFNVIK